MSNIFKYVTECDNLYGVIGLTILCACIIICIIIITKAISRYEMGYFERARNGIIKFFFKK